VMARVELSLYGFVLVILFFLISAARNAWDLLVIV
jgi:hypothetical protein